MNTSEFGSALIAELRQSDCKHHSNQDFIAFLHYCSERLKKDHTVKEIWRDYQLKVGRGCVMSCSENKTNRIDTSSKAMKIENLADKITSMSDDVLAELCRLLQIIFSLPEDLRMEAVRRYAEGQRIEDVYEQLTTSIAM